MISVLNYTERLFGGFDEQLQIKIVSEDRSKIFNMSPFVVFALYVP